MSMSGLKVNPDCLAKHTELKMKKLHKCVTFKISDDKTEVVVGSTHSAGCSQTEDWNAFVDKLEPGEPMYGLFDFHYTDKEGKTKEDLLFVQWCSDDAPVKKRMVFATTKDTLVKKLDVGPKHVYQVSEKSELTEEEVIKHLLKK